MTYSELLNFMRKVAESHTEIQRFYLGDYENIQDLLNDPDFKTPTMWMETPEASILGTSDANLLSWKFTIVIFDDSNMADSDDVRAKTESTFTIATDVLRFMEAVSEDTGRFSFDITKQRITPIMPLSGEHLVGWALDISLNSRSGIPCLDAARWTIQPSSIFD